MAASERSSLLVSSGSTTGESVAQGSVIRLWIDDVSVRDVVLDPVEDDECIGGVEGADVDRLDVGRVDVEPMDVERMDVEKDDLGCAVVEIVVDTDPLVLSCVRDTCSVSCSSSPVGFSGLFVSDWLGSSGFGESGTGDIGSASEGTVILNILQKKGNTSQKRNRPPDIEIFGMSGGPMGGPVSPILYHIPAGPTAMTAAATAPVIEAGPLIAGRAVVIFSADVMFLKFANVSLYMTWLVPSRSIVARSGYGVTL